MPRIARKISKIKFQLIKNSSHILTDEQLIYAVQSIYDAMINEDTIIPPETIMPQSALGVELIWTGTTMARMMKGSLFLDDDFTDNIKPNIGGEIEEPMSGFQTNGKFFQTNGNYFVTNSLSR